MLKQTWAREFQDKNLPTAQSLYQRILKENADLAITVQVLAAVALTELIRPISISCIRL
ncbi:MAG: hypothetical protein WC865_14155 [Bacteroidales bacterium]